VYAIDHPLFHGLVIFLGVHLQGEGGIDGRQGQAVFVVCGGGIDQRLPRLSAYFTVARIAPVEIPPSTSSVWPVT
jgi:hypothetical protein